MKKFKNILISISCAKNQEVKNTQPLSQICETCEIDELSLLKLNIDQNVNSLNSYDFSDYFINHNFIQKRDNVLDKTFINLPVDEALWGLSYKNSINKKYYSPNRHKISDEWFEKIHDNANKEAYKSVSRLAITTKNTLVRNLPTSEPIFLSFNKAGEGYPFDYLQSSVLHIDSPVFVSHYSKDRAWVLVESDALWGWIDARDIRYINESEKNEIKNSNFISVLVDDTPVYDKFGNFLFEARMGAVLRANDENATHYMGKVFTQNRQNEFYISKDKVVKFPAKFNSKNLKYAISSVLGEPYGWGGFGYYRDCSLFIKDLFATFGLWLPRNSKQQGKIGYVINLKNMSNEEKLNVIKKYAVPFLTIFYMPGHVMLYAGNVDDKPVAIHDAWGIKTKDNSRALISQIAITELDIGKDRDDIDEKSLLLSKITSMNVVGKSKNDIISQNYGVTIKGNEIMFKDGSKMSFKDDKTNKNFDELLDNPSVFDMLALPYFGFSAVGKNLNDAGRFRNEEFFGKIYGKNKQEVEKNLVDIIWLKNSVNKKFKFNKQNGAAKAIQNVSDDLDLLVKNRPELLKYLNNPSGTYNYRKILNSNNLSSHSWGIAIDINTNYSHYWQWSKTGLYENSIPKEIVDIFEKYGFIWGGRWEHFDTMHFEYRPEFFQ
ncbi:M15 family metallopeptidase [Campylobacter sputorum]|uniref:bifunctional C40 family peptidase/M15 family metallopeptidase n=1 Tax=Campylobacter sputorum TaxID=206 RepID=UPI000B779DE1|nr:M15 family metallopeptidase [Campylobacter sputorum]ASM36727.1 putative cysteine peptidase, peptidase M15 family (SH3, Nlp/P60 domains) [Campylobacter sputorum bv. faecalis CCUG 20703]